MILQCQDINKSFNHKPALVDINLQIRKGEIYILLGPNGSGKTTLLKILSTLITPDQGNASINGHDIISQPRRIKSRIGCVFPDARSFYWRLTVMQNLIFFGALYGLDSKTCRHRVSTLLRDLNQEALADIPIRNCSSGMRQIVACIRGILHDPPILLLDEPTRSLSPEMADKICNQIHKMSKEQEKTVLMSSHNLLEAEALADRLGIIEKGKLLAEGTLEELIHQSGHLSLNCLSDIYSSFIEQDAS
ncbi:MAG: ABC transporter ATP-binding protein [Desulfobacteraceae bacterium]|jgi:ABC-2 type transport system ATP-binding protein|nr:ABC transporter ATP-binding protein [Desulfobacteraceae bacterium]